MFPRILSVVFVSLCSAGFGLADTYTVYLPDGMDTAVAENALEPLRRAVPNADYNFITLRKNCNSMHDAVQAAKAIRAGITHLPSLVLADENGEYAAIPLHMLDDDTLSAAHAVATDTERDSKSAVRRFQAKEYLLFARLSLAQPLSDEVIELSIKSCKTLMEHDIATPHDKQLLGFRCLYPLLMLQYTNGYKGAHTPETEAKLLEAIAALEAARDIDPASHIGRQAFAERERLRTARRKARQYE